MVQPLLRGRGVSSYRTPTLVRDYLSGQGPFADDPPEELAQRRAEGAYVAQVHQRVKQHIKQLSKERRFKYQWPRRQSFQAHIEHLLLLGLLVETGRRAEPEHRGAGRLGTAGGFSERVWVRLAPGAETRPEWADPLGYLIILKQNQDPSSYHNIRLPGRVLATGLPVQGPVLRRAPVQGPVLRRAPALGPVPAREPAPTAVSTEGVRLLEERRQTLQRAAETVSRTGINADGFEQLLTYARQFHAQVLRLYSRTPFPDLSKALDEAVPPEVLFKGLVNRYCTIALQQLLV